MKAPEKTLCTKLEMLNSSMKERFSAYVMPLQQHLEFEIGAAKAPLAGRSANPV